MDYQSLQGHLGELRTRLIRMALILCLVFVSLAYLAIPIGNVLLIPLKHILGDSGKIVFLNVFDQVIAMFQISAWATLVITLPLWLRELWGFVRPALHKHEIRVVRSLILLGLILFYVGLVFGYWLLVPATIKVMLSFGFLGIEATIGLKDYLAFVCQLIIISGVIFQIPLILLGLSLVGVISKDLLSQSRRYAYVILAVVAAVITPADVFTMIIVWVPLIALFELGILAVTVLGPFILKKTHT